MALPLLVLPVWISNQSYGMCTGLLCFRHNIANAQADEKHRHDYQYYHAVLRGPGTNAPELLVQKFLFASGHLKISSWQEMTDETQRVAGRSCSSSRVCYNVGHFKTISGVRRIVIVDWDIFRVVPGSRSGTPTPDAALAVGRTAMQIEKHDKSYIVKLEDGSSWRLWPGDIALTLGWSSMTVFEVSEIDDEFCSHALVDKTDGSRVRVIEASKDWPVQKVRQSLKKG